MIFRYIQLSHAHQTQFADGFPNPQTIPLVDVIIVADPAKLISTLYNILRTGSVARILDTAKIRWEEDIGPVDNSDWDEV